MLKANKKNYIIQRKTGYYKNCWQKRFTAPSMIDIKDFADGLAAFLISTNFEKKNVILSTHDIIIITLLSYFQVYP